MNAPAPTIFVVERGEYSDYRVLGVFSTRQNAELIAEKINGESPGSYDSTVAEWPLDPAVHELLQGMQRWRVEMRRDGTLEKEPRRASSDGYGLASTFHEWNREESIAYCGRGIPNLLVGEVWARDAKHAIKITNDRRAQLLALNEWKGKL